MSDILSTMNNTPDGSPHKDQFSAHNDQLLLTYCVAAEESGLGQCYELYSSGKVTQTPVQVSGGYNIKDIAYTKESPVLEKRMEPAAAKNLVDTLAPDLPKLKEAFSYRLPNYDGEKVYLKISLAGKEQEYLFNNVWKFSSRAQELHHLESLFKE